MPVRLGKPQVLEASCDACGRSLEGDGGLFAPETAPWDRVLANPEDDDGRDRA